MGNGRLQWPTCRFGDGTLGGLVKSRGGMSLQADEARAKIINCEALDDKQKAKMLLLINTEPDTTLPVFTGVPDFLLGHTLSMHLEGLKAVKMDQLLSITSKGVTPQEESAQSLTLTPGSRLSCSQAERVFSRLRVDFAYDGHYGEIKDQQRVQMFQWPPEATEDSVAEAACHHLQSTYMPEDVVVIAVQSVIWMGHEWPEAKVKVKETSRTDYVMVYRGLAPEMVDLLIDKQRMCTELKALVSKQETQLQTLEDELQESQASKRRRGATDSSAVSELVTHKGDLTESKGQLTESKVQLRDAYQDRIAALKDLLLHTVGHYEAKSEKAWTKVASTARAQAALGWLVLNANQLESSPSHPGSIAMVGDFNKHFFYPPPPSATNTLHSLQTVLKIQAKRTLDTENSRAKTAAHVKMTLRNLCNQLQANQAVILEGVFFTLCCAEKKSDSGTGGQRDRSEEGHEMANCDQNEHGRASGAPYGTDRGDTGESQDSGDNEAAMGNVLGAALTCQLRQPTIYKALGMDRPPTSIPVFDADHWLDSWHVIASSMPSQQAKLSGSAPQSSVLG
ncbi:MAG: hypothetical protein FRX49_00562 [Trebouxia sp. A1-2]|nr:MAG: hypothetical protein FRX49_00561 [Trebouxia sp. A1-2]KAA6429166.1 MAG: hypothetical protein FRX49_00562 [Trebouxia sp. A1-2]